jgi:uncharacterized protein YaaQ
VKLILAIVKDSDVEPLTQALTGAEFRVTRIASTGGWLRRGVATLLIGVEDTRVEAAVQLLRDTTSPAGPDENRATVFILPVEHYERI